MDLALKRANEKGNPMNRSILAISLLPLLASPVIFAQVAANGHISLQTRLPGSGRIVLPQSGIQRSEDVGLRSRTQFKVLVPAGRPEGVAGFNEAESTPRAAQPVSGYYAETPASLACLYGLEAGVSA